MCLSLSAAAQQNGGSSSPQLQPLTSSPQSGDSEVRLDVIVTDKSGKPVSGLQQQDFTILDNKHPAKVLSFQAENGSALTPDAATQIILVIDEINTPFAEVANARSEIKRFLAQNGGKLAHPVKLAFASYRGVQMQTTPSSDGNSLIAILDQHPPIIRSGGAAENQVQSSLNVLNVMSDKEKTQPGRKMVIWISPGWPMENGRRVGLSPTQANSAFNALVYSSIALQQAQIALYSVDPMGMANMNVTRVAAYLDFLKGVPDQNLVQPANLALQVFATQTGGQVVVGKSSIVEALNQCMEDLDSFYSLTVEAAPVDHANAYHGLEIKMGTKGLKVRSRTGYYTRP